MILIHLTINFNKIFTYKLFIIFPFLMKKYIKIVEAITISVIQGEGLTSTLFNRIT